MYTFFLLISFSGFFLLYNTSGKARLSTVGTAERWIQGNAKTAKPLGIALILVSFLLFIWKDGLGAGTISALLLLMLAAALTVVIAPLQFLKLKQIILIISGSLLLEYLFS